MITPVGSVGKLDIHVPAQPAPRQAPEVPTEKSGTLSHDQVTLKSAGQVDAEKK